MYNMLYVPFSGSFAHRYMFEALAAKDKRHYRVFNYFTILVLQWRILPAAIGFFFFFLS